MCYFLQAYPCIVTRVVRTYDDPVSDVHGKQMTKR